LDKRPNEVAFSGEQRAAASRHAGGALFARAGTTPAARKTLAAAGGILMDLSMLFADLSET
jgi:hypothetical protein